MVQDGARSYLGVSSSDNIVGDGDGDGGKYLQLVVVFHCSGRIAYALILTVILVYWCIGGIFILVILTSFAQRSYLVINMLSNVLNCTL